MLFYCSTLAVHTAKEVSSRILLLRKGGSVGSVDDVMNRYRDIAASREACWQREIERGDGGGRESLYSTEATNNPALGKPWKSVYAVAVGDVAIV